MRAGVTALVETLAETRRLSEGEYQQLIEQRTPEAARLLSQRAVEVRRAIYGREVFPRGLIEISSFCKNDCYYCGIRRSNARCRRYRLTGEEILACAAEGYALGLRSFVLQGGEDPYLTDEVLCPILSALKARFPDCAVTLSLGERSRESYQRLFNAGAERYLLRHETADRDHYRTLHPPEMSFERRMDCLETLREIGYQVGCGFMVGSPGQTSAHLAKDLKFIESFQPEMCGVGPFLPHRDTPFRDRPAGSAELTCCLLSVIRLICPAVLLPATTALGTLCPQGRERGVLAGANVVMPNLSPPSVRGQYELYDGKLCDGAESAQGLASLEQRLCSIGYELSCCRGDPRPVSTVHARKPG